MARMTLTSDMARAAAQDAANRQMRKAGRKKWSRADYNLAVRTFGRLWPKEKANPGGGEMARLVDAIRAGDRVTIINRLGQKRTGRAVMHSSVGGWVLNMGGPHGTPGLADDSNIVKVVRRNPTGRVTRRVAAKASPSRRSQPRDKKGRFIKRRVRR